MATHLQSYINLTGDITGRHQAAFRAATRFRPEINSDTAIKVELAAMNIQVDERNHHAMKALNSPEYRRARLHALAYQMHYSRLPPRRLPN